MAEPTPAKEKITFASTLKSSDTEEKFDIIFYRRIGFRIALFCAALKITPNAVTIASIFFGIAGGILFYYPALSTNVIGMFLLVFANSLDSADGQLARITNNKSRIGRILDGLAGDSWFVTIHIAICLRSQNEGWSPFIWVLGSVAGASHILQSAMGDYYRNVHLYFIKGRAGSELDNSAHLQVEYDKLTWSRNTVAKFMARSYLNYTKLQERFTPHLQKLLSAIYKKYPGNDMPETFVQDFRKQNKPLMRFTNIIQFNTRVMFLFVWLFINQSWLYFIFDIVVLNAFLVYMMVRQEKVSRFFYDRISKEQ